MPKLSSGYICKACGTTYYDDEFFFQEGTGKCKFCIMNDKAQKRLQKKRQQEARAPGAIYAEIAAEVGEAQEKFPDWPTDIIHGVAIMAEESGEAVRAALHCVYENRSIEHLKTELIQTAAMCVRMLLDIEKRKGEGKCQYTSK